MNTKNIPVVLMLTAGAVSSVIMFLLHYEGKAFLWVLTGVLVIFYILGRILKGVLDKFQAEVEQKEAEKQRQAKEKEDAEGTVLEKEMDSEHNENE